MPPAYSTVGIRILEKALFQSQKSVQGDHSGPVRAYRTYAEGYYVDPLGRGTREPVDIKYALLPLVEHFPALPVEQIGPLKLKEIREAMIDKDWSRGLINRRIGIIKRMFKWAASEQIVSAMILYGLQAVTGLKKGRCRARETEKRRPVAEEHVMLSCPICAGGGGYGGTATLTGAAGRLPSPAVDIDRPDRSGHYYRKT